MKKFLAGAMALVMMFSFAACSSGGDVEQPSDSESNTEGSAEGSDTFLIGGIGPLTGGAA